MTEQGIHSLGIPSLRSDESLACLMVSIHDKILSGHSDGTVKLWRYRPLQVVVKFRANDDNSPVTSLCLSNNENLAVTSSQTGEFSLWNLQQNPIKLLRCNPHSNLWQ